MPENELTREALMEWVWNELRSYSAPIINPPPEPAPHETLHETRRNLELIMTRYERAMGREEDRLGIRPRENYTPQVGVSVSSTGRMRDSGDIWWEHRLTPPREMTLEEKALSMSHSEHHIKRFIMGED